jgi:hypothetical protein
MVTKQTAFPAIKVLQHTKPHDPSVLADILEDGGSGNETNRTW